MTTCTWCGSSLTDPDEIANPPKDADGDIICDHCYNDECMQECVRCEGYYDKSERDKVGALLVIFDADEAGVPVGVYEIVESPWPINDWVDKSAIKQLSSTLPFEGNDEIVGYICSGCTKAWKVKK